MGACANKCYLTRGWGHRLRKNRHRIAITQTIDFSSFPQRPTEYNTYPVAGLVWWYKPLNKQLYKCNLNLIWEIIYNGYSYIRGLPIPNEMKLAQRYSHVKFIRAFNSLINLIYAGDMSQNNTIYDTISE